MSHPNQVQNFTHELLEMAKAVERLPVAERELSDARLEITQKYDTIQRLELKLIDRNTTIDELNAKLRKAEAERDDAELRFLEADEKIDAFTRLGRAFAADLGALTKAVESVIEPIPFVPVTDPSTSSSPSTDTPPDTGSSGFDVGSGSTSAAPSYAYASDGAISPEPFSPETQPSDSVEVREETGPTVVDTTISSEPNDVGSALEEAPASPDPIYPSPATGQSEPLPTAASPIAESTAPSTNASPSGDANSPIDNPYIDEPREKWSNDWYVWAGHMDDRYGKYTWPRRRV